MHLIGRWEKVRPLSPSGLGLPYLLDTKWSRLLPYQHEEWWRSPSGVWVPTIRGGALSYGQARPIVLARPPEGISLSNIQLDSAYIPGTSGDAIGWRFTPPDSLTLTKVAIHIASYGGTAANVTDLDVEVRPEAGNPRPDTATLLGSGSMNPASATGWVYFTGLSIALTSGALQWLIVGDVNGNGTDFARVNYRNSLVLEFHTTTQLRSTSTTVGWTANPSIALNDPIVVMVFSDGTVMGTPFTALSTTGSAATERGWHFSDGLPVGVKVYAIVDPNGSASYAGARIWLGTEGPGGTPYKETTARLAEQGAVFRGAVFTRPFPEVHRNTPWRAVYTYGGSTNVPGRLQLGAGADADVKKAMVGGGAWIKTQDVGGSWVDVDDEQPNMAVLIDDFIDPVSAIVFSVSDGLR
jgi:hypothetical protein